MNWEEKLHDSMQGDGEANAEPVSLELDRGVSFAAKFTATRVKPGCCWTKAEARSFRGALKRCGEGNTEA